MVLISLLQTCSVVKFHVLRWRWGPPTSETYVCNGNKRAMALAPRLSMPAKFTLKTDVIMRQFQLQRLPVLAIVTVSSWGADLT